MNDVALRALGASATVLGYAALCLAVFWRERRRAVHQRRIAAELAGDGGAAPTLVLFGSQTGQAEAIAWQTAGWLRDKGEAARVLSLNQADTALSCRKPGALCSLPALMAKAMRRMAPASFPKP